MLGESAISESPISGFQFAEVEAPILAILCAEISLRPLLACDVAMEPQLSADLTIEPALSGDVSIGQCE